MAAQSKQGDTKCTRARYSLFERTFHVLDDCHGTSKSQHTIIINFVFLFAELCEHDGVVPRGRRVRQAGRIRDHCRRTYSSRWPRCRHKDTRLGNRKCFLGRRGRRGSDRDSSDWLSGWLQGADGRVQIWHSNGTSQGNWRPNRHKLRSNSLKSTGRCRFRRRK